MALGEMNQKFVPLVASVLSWFIFCVYFFVVYSPKDIPEHSIRPFLIYWSLVISTLVAIAVCALGLWWLFSKPGKLWSAFSVVLVLPVVYFGVAVLWPRT